MRRASICTGWVLVAAALSGCGRERGPERVVVTGTVTYNGKPVSGGTIRFVPVSTSPVPVAGAPIVNGTYRVDGKGGVPVGTHKIQIEAYHKIPFSPRPGEAAPPNSFRGEAGARQQYIPSRYNVDSRLQITIEPGSKTMTKDFDLVE